MHGEPAEPEGFAHFSYANPNAPKGGRITIGMPGSFDSLNPLIVKGNAVAGMREYVYETLLARGLDEPFSLYGLIAQFVEMPDDRSEIIFNIDARARFSDGKPITADDVLFSWELLKDKGRPNHRSYYAKVKQAEKLNEHRVRFVLEGGDREMPLILGLMPVLPKHAIDPETFDQTTLAAPIGSGPYRVSQTEPGRFIVYKRNPDYWGRDLPVNAGRFNFDEVRFEYYRDSIAMFEAFKSGSIDFWNEEDPARWASGYDVPAVRDGRITRAEFDIGLPAGMTSLAFNTRRGVFADPRVRRALITLFDFEWVNRNLYHSLYKRTESYFDRSVLSSHARPADGREKDLLVPFRDKVRPEIMDGTFSFPTSDGSGQDRVNLRTAFELLKSAGYVLDGRALINAKTRQPLTFEILATSVAQERLVAGFVGTLSRLGIAARIRVVDSAQYQQRLNVYDFDMIQANWPSSLSPGNEQVFRWNSRMASQDGTYNWAGVSNPAADAMIEAMLAARDKESFVSATRALDRVLLSGDYVIPLFYLPRQWVAYWSGLAYPERTPLFGYNIDLWWRKSE
ncbi:MAG: ABC transporter substrate-binding protein [Hyphomicrobiaceae bacterium]|nr:ABC transporter substrate-binding protein [Hyphomicrobiaceae bacterium]